jgi:gliding motility-associated-like protein
VEGTCELKLPNVFTPNDDGVNEEIRFDNACIKKMELMIFNRWGVMVYESNVIPVIWQPENLNDGVYYYLIKAIYVNDKSVEKTGYIQLIK